MINNFKETIFILGTKLTLFDRERLLWEVRNTILQERKIVVASGNVHIYNLAFTNPWIKTFLNAADVVRLDGAGVRIGAKILGYDTPQRMTWADFGWELAEYCQNHSFSMFLLGTRQPVIDKAKEELLTRYPDLSIVGCHHGYFDKSQRSPENKAVIQLISDAKPDILLVGFGMPLQERWISENYDQLSTHVIFTVGAAFDYISGELRRPPKWMTDHGFEWLGRMVIEPKRLWRRYIIGNPLFIIRIICQKLGLIT